MSENIVQFLDCFNTFTKKPQNFLSIQSEITDDIKKLIKNIYDFAKTSENNETRGNALPELIIENFDDEQIWQELELQNEDCNSNFISDIPQLIARKDQLIFPICSKKDDTFESDENTQQNENLSDNDEVESNADSDERDDFELSDEGEEDFDRNIKKKPVKNKPSVVDDKFFKLSEMEQFLELEEKNEGKSDSSNELINYFEDIEDPVSEKNFYYNDFFDVIEEGNPEETGEQGDEFDQENMNSDKLEQDSMNDDELDDDSDNEFDSDEDNKVNADEKKQVRFNLDKDDSEGVDDKEEIEEKNIFKEIKHAEEHDNKPKVKSTLELRQERLGKIINKFEEAAISEKPWQLKGEVTGGARPPNSLLEEIVDFDISTRPAPVITEETTLRLEDIILRRIKDKAWDDVERKVKPVETPAEFKKKLVLDQEKSKLSLAQIYEQEFIKQRDAIKQQGDDTEKQEVEPPLHNEVRSMLTSLFNKLDALCNYHYTPRPAVPELKIISNERAITMEEVAPVTVTDATLLAPEEIQGKKKGDLIGKEERTATDKKRARRIKKKRQREKFKAQVQKTVNKINPGLGNKYSKNKAEQDLKQVLNEKNVFKMEEKSNKAVKSTATFFRSLQDEVSRAIESKTEPVKRKKDISRLSAKRLKL